jgi:hypothetical protein
MRSCFLYKGEGISWKILLIQCRKTVHKQKPLGEEHPDTLNTLSNIAIAQYDVGRHDDAHVTVSRCLPLALKNGIEDVAANCVELISFIDGAREATKSTTCR